MDERLKKTAVLQPFHYDSVTLLEGRFQTQFHEMLEYFLALPDDDILYGFRRRAGKETSGSELGGWYSNDSSEYSYIGFDEIFNTFGQWLSFLGRAYRATGNQKVREKAVNLLKGWGETIDEDGYFFYTNDCNAHHYSYEKIMSGLVDLYVYAEIEEAADYLARITRWAEKHLLRTRKPASSERSIFCGQDDAVKGIDTEWYTLSEGLYRAYLATGDVRYKEFARVWHYDHYWDSMREKRPEVMTGVHGYSHVNNLGGAAMAYQVTGEQKYLDTITNGYEMLKTYQLMASGGYAFNEHMDSPDEGNYETVTHMGRSFEVPCGTWAIFKLVRHLISLTGEAKYGAWAETALYNAIGAALPMKDDDQRRGKTFYYADYRYGGGRKVYYENSFPCCSGTYPQAVTEFHNLIYYRNEEGIYITQYLPSRLQTEIGGMKAALSIMGTYPETDEVTVTVESQGDFCISLRIPGWLMAGDGRVYINEERQDCELLADTWLKLNRSWKAGDKIRMILPMHLRTSGITRGHGERAALMYGPVMLAAEGRHTEINEDCNDLKDMEATKSGLTFRSGDLIFRPYWTFGEREWYSLYLDYRK